MSRNLSRTDMAWWHQRYVRQSEWTKALRFHLYRKIEVARCGNILEMGCGTGVIANELAGRTNAAIYGMDIDVAALAFAREKASNKKLSWLAGDAEKLPFADDSLDLIVTHYSWLWAERPKVVLDECQRVLKKGGRLTALAEPDYSNRQDYPDGHPNIKEFLSSDLKKKGADPDIGGKLKDVFSMAGFKVETGSVNDKVYFQENPEIFQQEWKLLEKLGYPAGDLKSMEKMTNSRWMAMPLHWVIGRKA